MASEETVKVAAPDGAVAQFDIQSTGERFTATGGGIYDVPPRVAKLIKEVGGFTPNVGPMILKGGRCPGCGFASYFARCSRCGTDRRVLIVEDRYSDIDALGMPVGQLTMRAALANIAQAARVVTG